MHRNFRTSACSAPRLCSIGWKRIRFLLSRALAHRLINLMEPATFPKMHLPLHCGFTTKSSHAPCLTERLVHPILPQSMSQPRMHSLHCATRADSVLSLGECVWITRTFALRTTRTCQPRTRWALQDRPLNTFTPSTQRVLS